MKKRKINILYALGQTKYIAGAEIELMHIIKNLDLKRFNPLIVLPEEGKVTDFFKTQRLKMEIIPMESWNVTKSQLEALIKHYNISLVHLITLRLFEFNVAMVAKLVKLPTLWHTHFRLDAVYPYLNKIQRKKILGLAYSLSSKIITCSDYVKKQFNDIGFNEKVVVLRNGVDLSFCEFFPYRFKNRFRKRWGINKDDFLVGMVGRLTPQKRPQDFIAAASLIKRKYPKIKFIIVGGDSPKEYIQKLKEMNQKKASPVIFTDFCSYPEALKVLNSLDILVLPSVGDASPLVILEAMAYKKPVIATNSGGISELVLNGKTGILVSSRKPKELARAMVELIENPQKSAVMGKEAYGRVRELYDIRKTIDRLQKIYLQVLKREHWRATNGHELHTNFHE